MDQATVAARLRRFEGSSPFMYKCTGGEVTVGVGHAMESAGAAAALTWQVGGAPAGTDAVTADYEAVSAAPKGMVAGAYASLTRCRMGDADIEALVEADVVSFEAQLRRTLPRWDSYPETVQEALFDMAFNLGLGGLMKFPTMLKAVDAGDWATAAAQCHRLGISDERNQETANLFRQATSAAAG